MSDLPSGTITFLFTDVEGSTRLWERAPKTMHQAMARHDAVVEACVAQFGGTLVRPRGEGDSRFAVFPRAADAVAAAGALQCALVAEPWPTPEPVRVRVALHTGEGVVRAGDYYGPAPNRCARLRSLAHGGQVLLSAATVAVAQDGLPDGVSLRSLGVHRLKDLQRQEEVFQLLHPALPAEFPPLLSLAALSHNIPIQLTSFIGREHEMAEVKRLLASTRLLTLTGAGGCGKSRLALQVAADLLEAYPDGVWLVELASLAEPALIPHAVASALGVREEPGRPLLTTLADSLRPKRLLLILDNCEHLVPACASLTGTLLQRCPYLRIVATSRESLGLPGELTYRVPSMSLPDLRPLPSLEQVLLYDAVRLFVDRATLARPEFAVTTRNASALAQLTCRLDGIPLAIELAAARVRVLSVEQIESRLDDRFRLLTASGRTTLPRHQTLRAAMDWSYELLSQREQVLLRRLSVFAGGWTLEAAEAVCTGHGLYASDILDLLTQLIDKSLVVAEPQGSEVRCRLLETIRQYSRDRLVESEDTQALCRRHRDWCLALAEEAEPKLMGPDQAAWLGRLEAEHDNMRAALIWPLDRGDAETAMRLCGALWRFWWHHGHLAEGRRWLDATLARATDVEASVRAKALNGLGVLVRDQGDYDRANTLCADSLELYRGLGDKRGVADVLNTLAGIASYQGDYARAQPFFEDSLALYRELQDTRGLAAMLGNIGQVALLRGDSERAHVLCEESLTLFRVLGEKGGIAVALNNLGDVALHRGDFTNAEALLKESMALFYELSDREGLAECVEGLAGIAGALGRAGHAARLWGAAEALREAIGVPLRSPDRTNYERNIAPARAALGDAAFAAACMRGRAMTLEEIVNEAQATTALSLERNVPLG